MSLTVRTNVASIQSTGKLNATQKALQGTLGRISSGLRINQAADDAAGLGVATNLETTIISTRQAMRNGNDAISIIQTAESGTNEVTDILQRMRELAIQSASETLFNDERSYIQDEFLQLRSEVARIAQVTEFNGVRLADGTLSSLNAQLAVNNDTASRLVLELSDLTTNGLGISALNLDTSANALAALAEDFSRLSGLPCTVDVSQLASALPASLAPVALCLYRVVQEALTNVSRHAAASRVSIRLSGAANGPLTLEIEDDGNGIAPGAYAKPGSYGLLGMRERVRSVGGTLRLVDRPGGGTIVRIQVPVPSPDSGPGNSL